MSPPCRNDWIANADCASTDCVSVSSSVRTSTLPPEGIRGDTEPVHVFAAHKAIDEHLHKYGSGNKYHPIVYSIKYRNKTYQVEVVTRNTTIAATVITGVRNLSKIHYEGAA
ncbi:TPA: DUF4060 family protein [Serratia marcescens]|nr:DUF4060 family protein [Serratia marcescens]HEJ7073406.1 DUF4060 family protein [Serratia marcescens]HEJ7196461.1 DUF4060 family protein [Serratia marcescens]